MAPEQPPDGHVPDATYRLQLGPDLSFDDAAELAGYLARLGITDVYASPILEPVPGATHGYHITDPHRVNTALGGREGLDRLHLALERHGLSLLLDIVPNHLAAHPENPWWWDVLTHGLDSRYAAAFDIDWQVGGGRVALPTLGRELDGCIDAGELRLDRRDGEPVVAYHDTRYPLTPASRARAAELLARAGGPGPDELRVLLDRQHYRLLYWRTGVSRLNYRRFFDITDLVGVRVEDADVFDERHELILDLIEQGVVDGLRVDHVDGLRDPHGYLMRLGDRAALAAGRERPYIVVEKIVEGDEPLPAEWPIAGTTGYELASAATAVQVDPDGFEQLDGAYRRFTGLEEPAVDVLHERKIRALADLLHPEVDGLVRRYGTLAADVPDLPEIDAEQVRAALVALTASFPVYRTYIREGPPADGAAGYLRDEDRDHLAAASADARRRHPDLDEQALLAWERVLTVDLPPGADEAVRSAWFDLVARWQQLTGPAMAKGFEDSTFYVHNRLVALNEVGADAHGLDHPHGIDGFHERLGVRAERWPHAMNTTSTHDTKRSEDVRARIAVLSEIPERWAETVRRWHESTTHMRTEVAGHPAPDRNEEWLLYQTLVGMWPLREEAQAGVADRLADYAVKAAREAKVNTSWLDPDEAHEAALRSFATGLVGDGTVIEGLRDLLDEVALPGVCNALAQLTWRLTAPGVPDTYQGTELWDHSLVDPDNRRPVDHALRARLLDEVIELHGRDPLVAAREVRDTWWDGRLKLYLLWRLLHLRRERWTVLRDGGYAPLGPNGEHADRIVAFARTHPEGWVAAITPRHVAGLAPPGSWPTGDVWGDTTVEIQPALGVVGGAPGDRSRAPVVDVLTGREIEVTDGRVRVADALSRLPVAVLASG